MMSEIDEEVEETSSRLSDKMDLATIEGSDINSKLKVRLEIEKKLKSNLLEMENSILEVLGKAQTKQPQVDNFSSMEVQNITQDDKYDPESGEFESYDPAPGVECGKDYYYWLKFNLQKLFEDERINLGTFRSLLGYTFNIRTVEQHNVATVSHEVFGESFQAFLGSWIMFGELFKFSASSEFQNLKAYLEKRIVFPYSEYASNRIAPPMKIVDSTLPPNLKKLFKAQESERHKHSEYFAADRDSLILTIESRQMLNLRTAASYIEPFYLENRSVLEQHLQTPDLEKRINNTCRYYAELILAAFQQTEENWTREKECVIQKHHLFAEQLYLQQKYTWEKAVLGNDFRIECFNASHNVTKIQVVDDIND